ncbi:hypothetical protein IFR05_013189 [Cadophora sp. M221]|nr:hypothetical protein IFR05_013189 [Cadophora sp. M221]
MLPLSILALLPIASAAPTPDIVASSTEAIDWIPVDFEGKTLYVNSAALVESSVNPAKKSERSLLRRAPGSDTCGGSSFNSHPAPFASTADCGVIRDWAGTENTYWGVWNNTPDTHDLWYYGSCVFEAGTRNILDTYIGSTDVRDVIRDALNKRQSGGVVASQGSMGCENSGSLIKGGPSLVNWKIKHS